MRAAGPCRCRAGAGPCVRRSHSASGSVRTPDAPAGAGRGKGRHGPERARLPPYRTPRYERRGVLGRHGPERARLPPLIALQHINSTAGVLRRRQCTVGMARCQQGPIRHARTDSRRLPGYAAPAWIAHAAPPGIRRGRSDCRRHPDFPRSTRGRNSYTFLKAGLPIPGTANRTTAELPARAGRRISRHTCLSRTPPSAGRPRRSGSPGTWSTRESTI